MKVNPELKEELKKYIQQKMSEKRQSVIIVSPYSLSVKEIELIKSKFSFLQNAKIQQEVNQSLLAGIIIKFGSKMIDLSLNGQLQSLQKRIYASL